ncbi:MAG: enoyl-CoA hydratase [Candidatus Binatia bacterium]|nr:MAG: enoyl-CoA hydratase [Candidatus Binatia bacterium]
MRSGRIVREAREHGVRVLRLDFPPANAIGEALLEALGSELEEAERTPEVRALVLTGTGKFFSGGFDFSAPPRDEASVRRLQDVYRDVHARLLGFPKPTVGMLNGHAVAGGLVLFLACDYRLGVEGDYRVGLNEVAVGAAFPRAAFEIVRLRLAHARACETILGAALYPASQAPRLGIVDELFPPEVFEPTVLRRASRLAGFPREAYAHAKRLLVGDALERIRAETREEAEEAAAVWLAPESRAAREAQRKKLGIS